MSVRKYGVTRTGTSHHIVSGITTQVYAGMRGTAECGVRVNVIDGPGPVGTRFYPTYVCAKCLHALGWKRKGEK